MGTAGPLPLDARRRGDGLFSLRVCIRAAKGGAQLGSGEHPRPGGEEHSSYHECLDEDGENGAGAYKDAGAAERNEPISDDLLGTLHGQAILL
jgi:hypothetical protein